jgi:hypothetical protein
VTRPRAADDFATIRTRIEELRRERAQASRQDARDPDDTALRDRSLLKGSEGRARSDQERWPAISSSRRYGSGR